MRQPGKAPDIDNNNYKCQSHSHSTPILRGSSDVIADQIQSDAIFNVFTVHYVTNGTKHSVENGNYYHGSTYDRSCMTRVLHLVLQGEHLQIKQQSDDNNMTITTDNTNHSYSFKSIHHSSEEESNACHISKINERR